MSLNLYLAYVAACIGLALLPGPNDGKVTVEKADEKEADFALAPEGKPGRAAR